jgi:predicted esterase
MCRTKRRLYFGRTVLTAVGVALGTAAALAGSSLRSQRPAVADLESKRADLERRLDRISGHDSTKASIRYPFDLERVVALGRRPLPGRADHFDLAEEFSRSEDLLRSLESGRDPLWQAKGDHTRHHFLEAADEILPYRIYVPTTWNGKSALPLILMLHGSGATENTYMDNDDGALPKLAERRGFIIVCPLGYRPVGGFGNQSGAFRSSSARSPSGLVNSSARRRESELSEEDTLQVLKLVAAEYGADPRRVYLAGHSMGSGGAWHLAAKFPERWAAVAPMSGALVDEQVYPFDRLRGLPILMTEGTKSTGTLEASRALQQYLKERRLDVEYKEVDASHVGMVSVVWPGIFDFFDKHHRK